MLAWIETPQARIRLESQHLRVTVPAEGSTPEREYDLPLEELERVVLSESAHISTPALCALLQRDIPVVFHTAQGRHLGAFLPPEARQGGVRMRQYACCGDAAHGLQITRRLLHAKMSNQRRLLQRIAASRKAPPPPAVLLLQGLLAKLDHTPDLDALRGLEGAASAAYWKAWADFLPPAFPFEFRSSRPPHNPVNAVLSYLSTLVYGECLAACHRRGLDPALGILHPTTDGRWSLPLDLMEPFRPALVEPLTLRLFNHRILREGHFEPQQGGIYLSLSGRRLLLALYEKRLIARFLPDNSSHRTSLRDQMDATALSWKQALEDPAEFRPFLLN